MTTTYTIQIHRTDGRDEDFEADTVAEANQIIRGEWADTSVRRIVALREDGSIAKEWSR